MHPLLMISAGVAIWAASRQIPQARALAAALRAAAHEFQEQSRKAAADRRSAAALPPSEASQSKNPRSTATGTTGEQEKSSRRATP
jgi:hypothetical protein